MPWNSKNDDVQRQLSAPMPWIGVYVATASLICTLAMAADVLYGIRRKKYWFPSKFFSLNAMSLTLLAVAMKLPVDLTTRMYTATDRLAKVSSLALMSTSMANFLTSIGSMSNQDILMNVTALGILVVTVVVNVFIQVIQLHSFLSGRLVFVEEMLIICCMLVLLVMFCSSGLMLAFSKRYLETKYHEMHKAVSDAERSERGRVTADKLRLLVKKYWVMAETSSPQFVIARSVTCTSSGVVSLLVPLILLEAHVRMAKRYSILNMSYSDYGWSTRLILIVQSIGVIIGTIAPAARWFVAIRFRSSNNCTSGIKSAFTVEEYWTQKMVDWKQRSISFRIRHLKSRKILHDTRGQMLRFCILVQSLIVLASKLVLHISVFTASPFVACFNCIRRSTVQKRIFFESSSLRYDEEMPEPTAYSKLNIGRYVLLLEGEAQLPTHTLENICTEVDKVIHKGKMKKPHNLLQLLHRSCSFRGLTEFDSYQVPDLHSQELPYCWCLPIVTLTSIAIALPHVERSKTSNLLDSVTEGLSFAKRIDKSLDKKGDLANIRKAADVVWVGVELHCMWQDKDLHESSLKGLNSKEVLQELSDKAEKTVVEFMRDVKDCLMRNPLNWPAKVIAANAMYRISKTLLQVFQDENEETDDRLFERISVMIADILSACLTNLPRAITTKCHRTAMEEREKGVKKSALLVGQTEDIVTLLQQRELPRLTPDQADHIEEWRLLLKQENNHNHDSICSLNVVNVQDNKPVERPYAIDGEMTAM